MDKRQLQDAVARVQQMERYLDEVADAVSAGPNAVRVDAAVREKLRALADYYQNGQWLADYDRDARGELPAELKRGVLSQDALYDLLCAADNLE